MVFALFNVVWSTLFLEEWKRRGAELAYKWGTLDSPGEAVEEPRPQFRVSQRLLRPRTPGMGVGGRKHCRSKDRNCEIQLQPQKGSAKGVGGHPAYSEGKGDWEGGTRWGYRESEGMLEGNWPQRVGKGGWGVGGSPSAPSRAWPLLSTRVCGASAR